MKKPYKRIGCLAVAAATAAASLTPAFAAKVSFQDVSSSEWYYKPVMQAADYNLMSGMSSTVFDPQASFTRAQAVTVMANMVQADVVGTASAVHFSDVAESAWYAPYVNWGASIGLVSGMGDGTFNPNQPITREQMAALMAKGAEIGLYDLDADYREMIFFDADEIADWAAEAVATVANAGIMSGSNLVFSPKENTTRAQAAATFCNLYTRDMPDEEDDSLLESDIEDHLPVVDGSSVFGTFNYTGDQLDKILASTAIAGYGDTIAELGNQYGVNSLFIMAVAQLESGSGSSALGRNNNNLFGIMNSSGGSKFESKEACIEYFCKLMHNSNYYGKSIPEIGVIYCETPGWAEAVISIMDRYASRI